MLKTNIKLIIYLIVISFTLIGIYSFYKIPKIEKMLLKTWDNMNKASFRNSISRTHHKKGLLETLKTGHKVVTSKKQGLWIIDHKNSMISDSESLEVALHNSKPNDIIKIFPGVYKVETLGIDHPIRIYGEINSSQSEENNEIIIKVNKTSILDFKKDHVGSVLEFRNVTIKTQKKKSPTILFQVKNADLLLENVKIGFKNNGTLFNIQNESKIIINQSSFHSNDQANAIEVKNAAKATINDSQFYNFKNVIYTNINSYSGMVNVNNALLKSTRAAAIALYNGNLEITNSEINGGLSGIHIRNNAKIKVRNTRIIDTKEEAIDIYNSKAILDNIKIYNSSKAAIKVSGKTSLINLNNSELKQNNNAIEFHDYSKGIISNTTIANHNNFGLRVLKQAKVEILNSQLVKNTKAISCIHCEIKVENTQMTNNQIGLHLNKRSQIFLENHLFEDNKINIKMLDSESLIEYR